MNRVEIVNLGGRARHIEVDGAAAIDAWLEDARRRLNGDPDRDDLLNDFEQAIGEKCDAVLTGSREVVTTDEVRAILESLGTIEPSDFVASGATAQPSMAGAGAGAAAMAIEDRPRRLYRLPDERMIAGVCSGLAAWMRLDVTIVRAAWVLFPIFALGFTNGSSIPMAIGLYAILIFVLPKATSPEAKAAAHGYGTTAQDLLMQARSGVEPAMSEIGSRLGAVILMFMHVVRFVLLLAITATLVAWVVSAAWIAIAGEPVRDVFGPDFPGWLAPVFITRVAVVMVAPMAGVAAIVDYLLRNNAEGVQRTSHLTMWLLGSTAAFVAACTIGFLVIGAIPGMRELWATGESRIYFRGTTYCFVKDATADHCRPGDEISRDDPDPEFSPRQRGLPQRPIKPGLPGVIPPLPGTTVTPAASATASPTATPAATETPAPPATPNP